MAVAREAMVAVIAARVTPTPQKARQWPFQLEDLRSHHGVSPKKEAEALAAMVVALAAMVAALADMVAALADMVAALADMVAALTATAIAPQESAMVHAAADNTSG
jgi:hypothetical protein